MNAAHLDNASLKAARVHCEAMANAAHERGWFALEEWFVDLFRTLAREEARRLKARQVAHG